MSHTMDEIPGGITIQTRTEQYPDDRLSTEADNLANAGARKMAHHHARPTVTQSFTNSIISLPPFWRRGMLLAWDCSSWVIAVLLFVVIRYDLVLKVDQWAWTVAYTVAAVILQATLGLVTHVYLGRSRVGSFSEASWIGAVVLLTSIPLGLALSILTEDFPRGVALMAPPLALTLMAAGRWIFRILFAFRAPRTIMEDAARVIVYGAGEAGHQVAMLVDKAENPPYRIVGFVDDDPTQRRLRVRGHRVRGTGNDLIDVARQADAEMVIMAISNASPQLIQDVSDRCLAHGLEFTIIPPVRDMIGGQISLASLRQLTVEDLLGRNPIETDLGAISAYITGKAVLITGAGGSIGSELARQVHRLGPAKLILLDRDESALHGVQLDLYGNGLLDTDDMVLCDIRDHEALQAVFEHHRPEVVFHAAALKHLPMLERYPGEGWKTNVLGSLNVLRCARSVGVPHFVNISTDKAADASSTLGRTKRLAERLTAWYAQEYHLPYVSVRFGNVLGSRGSVLHSFKTQIARGGPVTVTHPEVTRYFMTIPEACELVLQAGTVGKSGEVLVLNMGEAVKIIDVANRLIAESGDDIDIHFTGLRQGEKLHEVLFSEREVRSPSEHPLINQVRVPALAPDDLPQHSPSTQASVEHPDKHPTSTNQHAYSFETAAQ